VGLRTDDGGALVFFTTHHYEKQTAAQGVTLTVNDANIEALMTGEPKQSLTLEWISNQAVLDPAKTDSDDRIKILSRVQGLTGARGE
jgi:pyridoxine/pyridoxamine 5'-phosphate oxidase